MFPVNEFTRSVPVLLVHGCASRGPTDLREVTCPVSTTRRCAGKSSHACDQVNLEESHDDVVHHALGLDARPPARHPATRHIHMAQLTQLAGRNGSDRPSQAARKPRLARLQTEGIDSMHPTLPASPRHPVFITGSVRSGTSALVDVMWQIGYEGFGEGQFLSLLHYTDAVVDQHYDRFPSTDPGVLLGCINRWDLKRRLFETFRTVVNDLNPKDPWFDKTADPGMILASPILRKLWPGSVFVFAKRRGIENVISRMKKFPGESFENHCAGWAGSMAEWRNIRQQLPPGCFIEVEQRDMIQQPERTARSLCAFCRWTRARFQALAKS